jgi:hypothetical protein
VRCLNSLRCVKTQILVFFKPTGDVVFASGGLAVGVNALASQNHGHSHLDHLALSQIAGTAESKCNTFLNCYLYRLLVLPRVFSSLPLKLISNSKCIERTIIEL